MDPGTAFAVISLTANAVTIIKKYYKGVAGAQSEIEFLINELESSRNLMERFQTLADSTSKLPMAASLNPNIEKALSELKLLQTRLDPGGKDKVMRRLGMRAFKWPFAKGDVDQCVTQLRRLKEMANLALNSDQT